MPARHPGVRSRGVVGLVLLLLAALESGGLSAEAGERTYPRGARTGVARVDRILGVLASPATVAEIGADLAALVRYVKVPCSTHPAGPIPAPPRCAEGEPDGTPVPVMQGGTCEGYYIRKEAAPAAFTRYVEAGPRLYAVYRVPKGGPHGGFAPRNGFGIVHGIRTDGFPQQLGVGLVLNSGGLITMVNAGCSETPRQYLRPRAGPLLLPPLNSRV